MSLCVLVDLSLYKNESQIEKKKSGKRKAKDQDAGSKSTPAAKKQKVTTTKARETPTARTSRSNVSKVSDAGLQSAKVRMSKRKNPNVKK